MFALMIATLITACGDEISDSTPTTPEKKEIRIQAQVDTDPVAVAEKKPRSSFWLGVSCSDIPEPLKQQLGLENGVLVQSIADDSPASGADLRPYDVLTSLDGAPVRTVEELVALVQKTAGRQVTLDFQRGGQPSSMAIQAKSRPVRQISMVMVGPDGTPICEDSEAMLKALSENETAQAYSILVVHPGVVMPKEKLSKQLLGQKAFEVHWQSSNTSPMDPAVLAAQQLHAPVHPTFTSPPDWLPRIETEPQVWKQSGSPHAIVESISTTDGQPWEIASSTSPLQAPPSPKLRVIRLSSASNPVQQDYRLEVETRDAPEVIQLRAQTAMLGRELSLIRKQLAEMQTELQQLKDGS
mgnify:CR=1 FL=1